MSSQILIQFEKLTKLYQTEDIETAAISGMDLEIRAGEYIAICGPSGGGKSSILSILGMLDNHTSGRYLYRGKDVSRMTHSDLSEIRNREIGFIFQSFNLIDNLTVAENVALPLRYRSDVTASELANRVSDALNSVGMAHRANHYPAQLSGGQQQRVAVARAFIIRPSIILADEPTGNLDSKSAEVVMELLKKQFESGVTICMVTHDTRYISDATRVINVFDGSVKNEILNGSAQSVVEMMSN